MGRNRYWTDRLRTHGRYVSLVVWNEPFTFVDEIEVYAGEPGWVDEPLPGPAIADVKEYAGRLAIQKGIRTRLVRDIESLRTAEEEEGVPLQTRKDVLGELAAVEGELGPATEFGDDFQAVLPLNPWHERVLRTQAWLWRARGFEPLTFWRSNLWDPLALIGMPDTAAEPAVEGHLMRRGYRAAAFNVSNSRDEPMQVMFRLSGFPGGDNPGVCGRTRGGLDGHADRGAGGRGPAGSFSREQPVYGLRALGDDAAGVADVPSGGREPGTYEGEVVVESVPGASGFPLRMHLYPLDFPEKQSLHLGGWDYTDRVGHFRLLTEQNRPANHRAPARTSRRLAVGLKLALPRGTHDAQGAMTAPPDTDYLDEWIELWPGCGPVPRVRESG